MTLRPAAGGGLGAVLRLTVLSEWPEHPMLHLDPAQPAIRTLPTEELEAIIFAVRPRRRDPVRAQTRLALPVGAGTSVRTPASPRANAFTDGYTFSVTLVEASPEACVARIGLREMRGGQSRAQMSERVFTLEAGRAGYVLVTGPQQASPLLLVVRAEWRDDLPFDSGFNPTNVDHYPVIATQVAVHQLPRQVGIGALMPGAALEVAAPGAAGLRWAVRVPAASTDTYFQALRERGNAEHKFSPSLMVRPGQSATIGTDWVDKAGLSTEGHSIVVGARIEGEAVWLTMSHDVRDNAGGMARHATLPEVKMDKDEVITLLHGPVDGHWYTLTIGARIIRSRDEYPFGRVDAPRE